MPDGMIAVFRLSCLAAIAVIARIACAWSTDHISPDPVISFPTRCIIWDGQLTNNRRLMVSNSPETISNLSTPVLWHDQGKGGPGETLIRHRIFLWHANGFAEKGIRVGVTVENLSTEHRLRLVDCRVAAAVGIRNNPIATVGLPVATRALDIESAPRIFLPDPSIAPAGSAGEPYIRGLIGWNLRPGKMVGAILEFTVSKYDTTEPGDLLYMVRTVVGNWDESMTGNPRLREGEDGRGLAPLQIKWSRYGEPMIHSRGSWDHCSVVVDNRARPFIYSKKPGYAFVTFPGVNDLLMTQATSYDPAHASPDGNAGNWGVTYEITVHTALPPGMSGRKKIEMRFVSLNTWSRHTGKVLPYAGAGRIAGSTGSVIPALRWGTSKNSTKVVWVFQPKPGGTDSQSFQLVHAGGACLPLGIRLKGI